jgi:hypothetical protein
MTATPESVTHFFHFFDFPHRPRLVEGWEVEKRRGKPKPWKEAYAVWIARGVTFF